jgi:hypothetical protein
MSGCFEHDKDNLISTPLDSITHAFDCVNRGRQMVDHAGIAIYLGIFDSASDGPAAQNVRRTLCRLALVHTTSVLPSYTCDYTNHHGQ